MSSLDKPPDVSLTVMEDAHASGWNIHLNTTNFQFTPDKINLGNAVNEGHAHLYIDNKKVARLYSPWHYVFKLAPGRHTFRVTLSSNNHQELACNGEPISAVAEIVQ